MPNFNTRCYNIGFRVGVPVASGETTAKDAPAAKTLERTAAGHPNEAELDVFLGEPVFTTQRVFEKDRIPNIAVGVDGTIFVLFGTPIHFLRFRRSEDGGKTWTQQPTVIAKDSLGHELSMHMNEHGITLRRGPHPGRLLRTARYYAAPERRKKWRRQYTTAIYSDDHGKTWQASEPFPARGTGEAGVAELSDGTIYYNSRRHAGDNPRHRWTARSSDGGETWKDLQMSKILPDGPRHTSYGCFGGLTRLPKAYYDKDFYSKPHCLLNRPLWPWTKMRFWWYRA